MLARHHHRVPSRLVRGPTRTYLLEAIHRETRRMGRCADMQSYSSCVLLRVCPGSRPAVWCCMSKSPLVAVRRTRDQPPKTGGQRCTPTGVQAEASHERGPHEQVTPGGDSERRAALQVEGGAFCADWPRFCAPLVATRHDWRRRGVTGIYHNIQFMFVC